MASTIETGFRMLKSHLEITDAQHSAIATRQAELEQVISKGFDTYGTTLSGAYSRNTMISVQKGATVDVFLFLRAKYGRQYTPEGLLDRLHDTLFNTYEDACINKAGNGVTVPLSDYQFNIMPCFTKENKGYVFPEYKSNQWERADPNTYSDQLIEADRYHNGNLLPLIKIIKYWNHVVNDVFDEYYLEILVKNILTDVPITSDADAISYIFKKATLEVAFTIDDPAGFGAQVQGLNDGDRIAEAMLDFHDTYKTSLNAVNHELEGELEKAYTEWHSIFTGLFPSPLQMLIQELEDSGIEGARALKIMRDRTL